MKTDPVDTDKLEASVRLGQACARAEREHPLLAAPDGTVAVQFTDLRALLDEIDRLRGMVEWQPIESAPQDGTAIWVATVYAGHGTGCMEPVRTRRHRYGEWTNIYQGHSIAWRPTHWRPLPSPPTKATGLAEQGTTHE